MTPFGGCWEQPQRDTRNTLVAGWAKLPRPISGGHRLSRKRVFL